MEEWFVKSVDFSKDNRLHGLIEKLEKEGVIDVRLFNEGKN
jgi:hypothetical protein